MGRLWVGLFDLEICLSVQVGSFDVAKSFWLGATQQDEVGWEEVIGLYSDDVSDADMSPPARFKLSSSRVEHLSYTCIEFGISLMSLDVFFDLLECRGQQDDAERYDCGPSVGGGYIGNLLDAGGEEEEYVCIL